MALTRAPIGGDRFEILRTLGEGGMGIVYLAYDRELRRQVALKTLSRIDPGNLYRFKREFRALAGVHHPNLARLHELISERELWFFTMEYVDGKSFLAHVCGTAAHDPATVSPTESIGPLAAPSRPPPRSDAHAPRALRRSPVRDVACLRDALRQLALAIRALHRAGKLHKDVKPSNVLVTHEGRVVLLDFGMVDDRAERIDSTLDDKVFGTPAYMAPEQAAGVTVGEAADWYAFGAMLYEALTGSLPFDGTVLDILVRKQEQDPIPAEALAADVPLDLARLCARLLSRAPTARPSGDEIVGLLGGVRPSEPPPRAVAAGFVGREAELQSLRRALAATRELGPRVVLLRGQSGIGKSALLRTFARQARAQDAVVLAGRCYERESVPFKAIDGVVDALCRHLARLPEVSLRRVLPRYVPALARLFPVLRQIDAIDSAPARVPEVADPTELRRRGVAALRELLARMADEHPLVLCIDDAQWSDEESAALLEQILRPPSQPALLVLCAHRAEGGALSPLTRLSALGEVVPETIDLGPLAREDCERLAAAELAAVLPAAASAASARQIADASEGNPFFVRELALSLPQSAERPPHPPAAAPSIDGVVRSRVAALPAQERVLLEVIALSGQPIEQGLALQAAHSSEHGYAQLDSLRGAHLLRTSGARPTDVVECYHDRVRRAVAAQIEPGRMRDQHLRLAEVLGAAGGADAETLAHHFHLGGDHTRALQHAMTAATAAGDALAFDRAAQLYRFVLGLPVLAGEAQAEVYARLGQALANAGRSAQAGEAYLRAAEFGGAHAFERLRLAAEHFLRSGRVDEGLGALKTVLAEVELSLPRSPRRALLALLLRRTRLRLRGLSYDEHAERVVSSASRAKIDACWTASVGLGLIDFVRGADFQTRHLLLALDAGEPYRVCRALALEAGYLAADGHKAKERVAAVLHTAEALASRVARPHARGLVVLARGMASWHLGDFRTSLPLLRESERIFREQCTAAAWEIATAHIFEAAALYYLGELRTLREQSSAHLREALARGDYYAASDLQAGVHVVPWLAADAPGTARAVVAEEKSRWPDGGFHLQHWNQLLADTLVDLYCGEGDAAYARVTARWGALERSLVRSVQVIRIESCHLRAYGALAKAAGGGSGAQALIDRADRDAARIEHEARPWASALAALIRGLGLLQRGQAEPAAQQLRRAAEALDAADLAMHAAAARYRLGQLVGGAEGAELVAATSHWLCSQGVNAPARFVKALAPAP